jgi:hypothetical protein
VDNIPVDDVALEARYNNLRLLRQKADSVIQFAAKAGLSQAQASQLTTTGPRRKKLGETLARKIETNLGLPRGWLDNPHAETEVPELPEGDDAPPARTPRIPASAPAQRPETVLALGGLTPVQVALLTTAAQLCRSGALPDKQCIALMATWQDLIE